MSWTENMFTLNHLNYYFEVSQMMYGFGDSHKRNPDTVRMVEGITLNQLRLIIHEASKNQNGKELKGEDLVFLMRKNKYKMRRFIKYLNNKDAARKQTTDVSEGGKPVVKNPLIEFIESIDETGELTDLSEYDEVKYERMIRADRISLCLNEENYIKYSNARCASFMTKAMSRNRNMEKLKQWIDPKNEIMLSNTALEVLSYFAHETVALITDYALLVRMDHNRKTDPLSNLQGAYFSGPMFNGDHRFSGENPDYSRVYNGQAPISVAEIKEVMRRVYMPHAGRLNFGRQLPQTQHILVL